MEKCVVQLSLPRNTRVQTPTSAAGNPGATAPLTDIADDGAILGLCWRRRAHRTPNRESGSCGRPSRPRRRSEELCPLLLLSRDLQRKIRLLLRCHSWAAVDSDVGGLEVVGAVAALRRRSERCRHGRHARRHRWIQGHTRRFRGTWR